MSEIFVHFYMVTIYHTKGAMAVVMIVW